ncbi:MAG: SsrA-binding protein SmpB [Planctomycetes bacterium]|nr:SsrA-binding protein SmpB [Planctomycetota bacterium]
MAAKKASPRDDSNERLVCRNRRARHEYDILDELECGVVLTGSEVKSIRNGQMSIEEAFARIRGGELWLIGSDIAEYPQATVLNHEPKRPRKLLLHKKELAKFAASADERGLTLVPLAVYFKGGRVKVKVGLARGRKLHDKREKLRQQSDRREMREAVQRRRG